MKSSVPILLAALLVTGCSGNNKPVARIQLPAPPRHLAVADQLAWVDVPGTGRVYPISF